MLRHLQVECAHLLDEGGALATLEPRVLCLLLTECRHRRSLVVVRRVNRERVVEAEEFAEEAFVQRLGIAGGEIRPPRGTPQQSVPREHAVGQHEADRVVGVTRRVEHV